MKDIEKLQTIGQEHLLRYWDSLSEEQKKVLHSQIQQLDISLFRQQQSTPPPKMASVQTASFEPCTAAGKSGHSADFLAGKALLQGGKVGCLLAAGGQGTRLQFQGPKGLFPVSVIQHKTLFQLFSEKTKAASQQVQRPLPLAIMTSPLNHREITEFFEAHHRFGLSRDQLSFFTQGMLPFLDKNECLFLESSFHFAEGPDGNGGSLHHFFHSGTWERWKEAGVEYVVYILIDNPLADPFDAELVGYTHRLKAEITLKCTQRQDLAESVGVLVKEKGKIRVKEYSELSKEEKEARDAKGGVKHPYANLSLFCFSMSFIRCVVEQHPLQTLPLHRAFKAASFLDQGLTKMSSEPIAWKFERFIFDLLPFASKVEVLEYPRERCFSPLKNKEGLYSLERVQRDLQSLDAKIFKEITGNAPPSRPFELAQEFYYPSPALLEKWKGRSLPEKSYIEP